MAKELHIRLSHGGRQGGKFKKRLRFQMVAWWMAKGGKVSIKTLISYGRMVEDKGGERVKIDLQFKQSIVEAQVSTGGGS